MNRGDDTAQALADEMFVQVMADGQSARRVESDARASHPLRRRRRRRGRRQ